LSHNIVTAHVLSKITGIEVDMSNLEKQAKENRDAIERAKEASKGYGRV
jgi:proteasome assembly chaperone (PAC2) family protein